MLLLTCIIASEERKIKIMTGRQRVTHLPYGPFNEEGYIDGILVGVGGKDKSAHALIETGDKVVSCEVTREQAKELAVHIYGNYLRFSGMARWYRNEFEEWELKSFKLSDFFVLDDAPLSSVVANLRTIEGSGWKNISNPVLEILNMRPAR